METDPLARLKAHLDEQKLSSGPRNLLPADAYWLVAEVERLQRFEAMWEDCKRHRDQAEKRARRYMGIIQQVAELVVPDPKLEESDDED
jgi:hypothetical protein